VLQCVLNYVCTVKAQLSELSFEDFYDATFRQVVVCCSMFEVYCSDLHVKQCVAVCCSVLQSVLQCVTVCCSVLQCVAVCCSVLQCVAVCCSVLLTTNQRILRCGVSAGEAIAALICTLQHSATHCNILQHTATRCNTLHK